MSHWTDKYVDPRAVVPYRVWERRMDVEFAREEGALDDAEYVRELGRLAAAEAWAKHGAPPCV